MNFIGDLLSIVMTTILVYHTILEEKRERQNAEFKRQDLESKKVLVTCLKLLINITSRFTVPFEETTLSEEDKRIVRETVDGKDIQG